MSNGDILADIIPCYRTFLIPVSFAYHAHSSDATNHASHHIHKKHREQVGKKIQLQPQHRTAAPSTSQPQLVISMTPIHTDLANSMRKDATQHQYFTFLEKMKFGWAPTLIDKIDWDPIHDALAKFHTVTPPMKPSIIFSNAHTPRALSSGRNFNFSLMISSTPPRHPMPLEMPSTMQLYAPMHYTNPTMHRFHHTPP